MVCSPNHLLQRHLNHVSHKIRRINWQNIHRRHMGDQMAKMDNTILHAVLIPVPNRHRSTRRHHSWHISPSSSWSAGPRCLDRVGGHHGISDWPDGILQYSGKDDDLICSDDVLRNNRRFNPDLPTPQRDSRRPYPSNAPERHRRRCLHNMDRIMGLARSRLGTDSRLCMVGQRERSRHVSSEVQQHISGATPANR